MDDFFMQQLMDELTRDERAMIHLYDDATGRLLGPGDTIVGNPTIGVGNNLMRPLKPDEMELMLRNDILDAVAELNQHLPWWVDLSDARRRALINMCFNLGWPRLSNFKKTLAFLKQARDLEEVGAFENAHKVYERAANEVLDSKWARQVGARAERIKELIQKG